MALSTSLGAWLQEDFQPTSGLGSGFGVPQPTAKRMVVSKRQYVDRRAFIFASGSIAPGGAFNCLRTLLVAGVLWLAGVLQKMHDLSHCSEHIVERLNPVRLIGSRQAGPLIIARVLPGPLVVFADVGYGGNAVDIYCKAVSL